MSVSTHTYEIIAATTACGVLPARSGSKMTIAGRNRRRSCAQDARSCGRAGNKRCGKKQAQERHTGCAAV